MAVTVGQIVKWMDEWAPPSLAEPDDKIGLLIGSMSESVTRVAVALDVTEQVADEAIERGAQLIIAHHPIIFRPLRAIRTDRADGRLMKKLLQHNIAVFAAHTNLDVAAGGVNDLLADAIGIRNAAPLHVSVREELYKLVVYIPRTHLDAVREAVFTAGAGHIGQYSHCGFSAEGVGTFLPQEGAKPFLGEAGRLEEAQEFRFETIVPAGRKEAVIRAMREAHPYEEVAYDVYRLALDGNALGLGRVGKLAAEMTLSEFADHVKKALGVPALRFVGDKQKKVRKAAVLGGSGRSFLKHAIAAGADVFVTGDLDHHTAHDALAAGLAMVDPGHHVEQVMKQGVADRLNAYSVSAGWNITAYASERPTEPFTFA